MISKNTARQLVKCWEHLKCGKRKCPVYRSSNLRCWLVIGTHCHDALQYTPEDKLLVCTKCEVLVRNIRERDWKDMFSLVHAQFNQYRQRIEDNTNELEKAKEQVNTMIKNLTDTMLLIDNLTGQRKRVSPLSNMAGIRTEELEGPYDERISYGDLIGSSPQIRYVYDLIEKVGPTDSTVVIQGESGTGKELIARALHQVNNRKDQRFVPVSCVALPETLLESEMFGYEPGAFTGADGRKYGYIELADKGTLFLDEIAEASASLQLKLLRVLQEREFTRVGGTDSIKVDIRLIAATNKNLQKEVSEGKVREDLYYRLNVVTINVPPLRDRKEDILLLADHFLKKFAVGDRKGIKTIASDAMASLVRYGWPGNVRQLENVIERAVTLNCQDGIVTLADLPPDLRDGAAAQRPRSAAPSHNLSLKELLSQTERNYLTELLEKTKGSVSRAAGLASLDRTNLHKKLHKYNINAANYR